MCVCLCVIDKHVSIGVPRAPKTALDSLELDLEAIVSHHTWKLGTKRRFCEELYPSWLQSRLSTLKEHVWIM